MSFLFNKPVSESLPKVAKGEFVEHPSRTEVAQQGVTKIIFLIIMTLVAPKVEAKRELLFSKPASRRVG